jgi:hypothetical protein
MHNLLFTYGSTDDAFSRGWLPCTMMQYYQGMEREPSSYSEECTVFVSGKVNILM